jgi:hypothetical protein
MECNADAYHRYVKRGPFSYSSTALGVTLRTGCQCPGLGSSMDSKMIKMMKGIEFVDVLSRSRCAKISAVVVRVAATPLGAPTLAFVQANNTEFLRWRYP